MTETTVEAADPTSITSRTEFGRALTALQPEQDCRSAMSPTRPAHYTVRSPDGSPDSTYDPRQQPAFRTVRSPGSGRGGDPRRRPRTPGRLCGHAAREPQFVPILESGPVLVGPMSAAELESDLAPRASWRTVECFAAVGHRRSRCGGGTAVPEPTRRGSVQRCRGTVEDRIARCSRNIRRSVHL